MTMVWKYAPYQGNTLLTLLALADWSNDDAVSWPSVMTLAKKSRQSERNTQACLDRLKNDGLIEIEERFNNSSLYKINLLNLKGCKDCTPPKSKRGGKRAGKQSALFAPNTSDTPDTPIQPSNGNSPSSKEVIDGRAIGVLQRVIRVEVFPYYLQRIGKNEALYTLTDSRLNKGVSRLRDCLKKTDGDLDNAKALMIAVIDELAASEFHNGKNQQQMKYLDWTDHLFNTTEKLEKWLERADS